MISDHYNSSDNEAEKDEELTKKNELKAEESEDESSDYEERKSKRPKIIFNIAEEFPNRINKLLEKASFDITSFPGYVIFKQNPNSQSDFFDHIFRPQLQTKTTEQIINYSIKCKRYIIVRLTKHSDDLDPYIVETLTVLSETLNTIMVNNPGKAFNLFESPQEFDKKIANLLNSRSHVKDSNRIQTFDKFVQTYVDVKLSRFSSMQEKFKPLSIKSMVEHKNICQILSNECLQLTNLLNQYHPKSLIKKETIKVIPDLDSKKNIVRILASFLKKTLSSLNELQLETDTITQFLDSIQKKISSINEIDSSVLIGNEEIKKITQDIDSSMGEKNALEKWKSEELECIDQFLKVTLSTLQEKIKTEKMMTQSLPTSIEDEDEMSLVDEIGPSVTTERMASLLTSIQKKIAFIKEINNELLTKETSIQEFNQKMHLIKDGKQFAKEWSVEALESIDQLLQNMMECIEKQRADSLLTNIKKKIAFIKETNNELLTRDTRIQEFNQRINLIKDGKQFENEWSVEALESIDQLLQNMMECIEKQRADSFKDKRSQILTSISIFASKQKAFTDKKEEKFTFYETPDTPQTTPEIPQDTTKTTPSLDLLKKTISSSTTDPAKVMRLSLWFLSKTEYLKTINIKNDDTTQTNENFGQPIEKTSKTEAEEEAEIYALMGWNSP